MSRIGEKFEQLKPKNEKALILFITAGDPNLAVTGDLLWALEASGADVVELGIPFSDPLADGPIIQAASQRALAQAVNVPAVLGLVNGVRKQGLTLPIVIMTYYNPVYKYGVAKFAQEAVKAGVDGVIISDLPPEEGGEWLKQAAKNKLDTIFLLAPTSAPQRIELIARYSSGFIYCVSRTGVTGIRDTLPADLADLVGRIKAKTQKPVAVGFGISNPQQVHQACALADGAVVGSAIVKIVEAYRGKQELIKKVSEFVRSLKEATVMLYRQGTIWKWE